MFKLLNSSILHIIVSSILYFITLRLITAYEDYLILNFSLTRALFVKASPYMMP